LTQSGHKRTSAIRPPGSNIRPSALIPEVGVDSVPKYGGYTAQVGGIQVAEPLREDNYDPNDY